jgi:hypothetical protein
MRPQAKFFQTSKYTIIGLDSIQFIQPPDKKEGTDYYRIKFINGEHMDIPERDGSRLMSVLINEVLLAE